MEYVTVKAPAQAEFAEKKSRFIGHIAPVSTEDQALLMIQEITKKHYAATHNVHAYVLRDAQIKRYSDNGEPQGTAGIPALDVLLKSGLTDVCAVVTRYFGGTMLGAGGLVRAYSHAVTIAIAAAQLIRMVPCIQLSITCDYSFYGKLSYMIPQFHAVELETCFSDAVCLRFFIRQTAADAFSKALTELSNGQVTSQVIKDAYIAMDC